MFQIFTEDRNRNAVIGVLHKHLKGYTLLFGEGSWRGEVEPCIIAQIVGVSRETIDQITNEIKQINSQESVLVIEHPTKVSVN